MANKTIQPAGAGNPLAAPGKIWPRRILRTALTTLAVLAVVGVLAMTGIYGAGSLRLNQRCNIDIRVSPLSADVETLARGRHMGKANTDCIDCDRATLGGQTFADAPPFLLVASTLTGSTGDAAGQYGETDWARATRYAVHPDHKSMLFIPAQGFSQWTDADLTALIAYIKSVPPVDNQLGASSQCLMGRIIRLAGKYAFPAAGAAVVAEKASAPPAGRTAEFGEYLVANGNCRECHGATLSGAPPRAPGGMPAGNLTPEGNLQNWTEEEFIHAMRTGQRPNGTFLSDEMPRHVLACQTDDELGAIYAYLRSLPPLPFADDGGE